MSAVSDSELLVMIVTLVGEGTAKPFSVDIKYYKVLKMEKEIRRRIRKISISA
jgi:hypothetical protein